MLSFSKRYLLGNGLTSWTTVKVYFFDAIRTTDFFLNGVENVKVGNYIKMIHKAVYFRVRHRNTHSSAGY